jgi:hypothetical protein
MGFFFINLNLLNLFLISFPVFKLIIGNNFYNSAPNYAIVLFKKLANLNSPNTKYGIT